jgi:hypothetical protein
MRNAEPRRKPKCGLRKHEGSSLAENESLIAAREARRRPKASPQFSRGSKPARGSLVGGVRVPALVGGLGVGVHEIDGGLQEWAYFEITFIAQGLAGAGSHPESASGHGASQGELDAFRGGAHEGESEGKQGSSEAPEGARNALEVWPADGYAEITSYMSSV